VRDVAQWMAQEPDFVPALDPPYHIALKGGFNPIERNTIMTAADER
jgi:hypothetical protein